MHSIAERQPSVVHGLLRQGAVLMDLEALARRVRAEFLEMPGLRLTLPQAARLWGMDLAACEAVIARLVRAAFLRWTPAGTSGLAEYCRASRTRLCVSPRPDSVPVPRFRLAVRVRRAGGRSGGMRQRRVLLTVRRRMRGGAGPRRRRRIRPLSCVAHDN